MNEKASTEAKTAKKIGRRGKVYVVIIAILILAVVFTYRYVKSKNPIYDDPYVISEFGEKEHVLEKNENNRVNVFYPVFESQNIDTTVKGKVDEYVHDFKERNLEYSQLTDSSKADFKIGYESYKVTDDVISLVLEEYEKVAFSDEYTYECTTFTFDLKNDTQIYLEDFFKGRYLNYISSYAEKYICESEEDISYDMLREALTPTAENFSKYVLNDDEIKFYFEKSRFSDKEVEGAYVVHIPYEDMNGYFKRGYLEGKTTQEDYMYEQVNGPVDDRIPTVAITFDDGPGDNTQKVVDILRENNAVASFFMLGERISLVEPEVLKGLLVEGSTINSHSYNHSNFKNLSSDSIKRDIEDTTTKIHDVTDYEIHFFRPPYGSYNDYVKENVNLPLVLWSVDPRDWDIRDPNVVYDNVLNSVKDGDVILLHEIHDSTVEALPRILEELNNRGYQIVTVEEMYYELGRDGNGSIKK